MIIFLNQIKIKRNKETKISHKIKYNKENSSNLP